MSKNIDFLQQAVGSIRSLYDLALTTAVVHDNETLMPYLAVFLCLYATDIWWDMHSNSARFDVSRLRWIFMPSWLWRFEIPSCCMNDKFSFLAAKAWERRDLRVCLPVVL